MEDHRSAEGVEHLQAAARELLLAARSFIDVMEEVVEDRDRFAGAAAGVVDLLRDGLAAAVPSSPLQPWEQAAWEPESAEGDGSDEGSADEGSAREGGADEGSADDPVDEPAPARKAPARKAPARKAPAGRAPAATASTTAGSAPRRVRRIAVD